MGAPIRVLQVFMGMNMGGAESMIMNLYRKINRSEIQFDFIVHTDKKCDYDEEILELGGKIYNAPKLNWKNYSVYVKWWENFFKENDEYKLIHGHVRSVASIYLRIAKKNGLTTIIHSHSMSSGTRFASIGKKILRKSMISVSDYLFSCSKNAGEWFYGRENCSNPNFKILKNAIDTKKFLFDCRLRESYREEYNISNKLVIGHIGSFRVPKNHDFLLDVFKAIYDRRNDAVLMLVGDGELKGKIEKKVKRYCLEKNVIFAGLRTDIPGLLSAMDVLVFPSLWEGLPVTLIEAQASGLPCVISDVITKEVMITKYISCLSLDKSPKEWADTVLSMQQNLREDTSRYILESGYDNDETSYELASFYIQNISR